MGAHVVRVAADVGDQEKGTPRLHARILSSRVQVFCAFLLGAITFG